MTPLHRSETSTKALITLSLPFKMGAFAFPNAHDEVGRAPNGIIERYGPVAARASGMLAPPRLVRSTRLPALLLSLGGVAAALDVWGVGEAARPAARQLASLGDAKDQRSGGYVR